MCSHYSYKHLTEVMRQRRTYKAVVRKQKHEVENIH